MAASPIRRILFEAASVAGIMTLAAAVLFWPWMTHLSIALIGPPEDNLQDFWNSWYAAVGSDPRHFFHTSLIRFPEGTPLNYHSFAYPQVFLLAALTKLLGTGRETLILLQNLTLLLSFPVAGAGAYYLVRHFTHNAAASLISAFLFAFNPWHVAQAMHHAHVSWIGFIPFFVLTYLLALERKSWLWLCVSIVLYALSALSCWYYLFYNAFFILFHAIYLRVRDNELPKGWRLTAPLACMAGTALLLSPLLAPMALQSGHTYTEGNDFYVADLFGYVLFPPTHILGAWARGAYAQLSGNPWESAVYLGLVNLAVLVWYRIRTWREGDPVLVYALCGMATFCVFASGETLHALGRDFTYIHLPDIVLAKLPFVANVRTPARAIVMVFLFLSIGIGQALSSLSPRVLAGIALLIIADFWPINLATTEIPCAHELDVVARDRSTGFGVLNLPSGYLEGNIYMLQQTCHGKSIVRGNVSRVLRESLTDRLETADLRKQREQLIRAHVKYIVLERARDGLFAWTRSDGQQKSYLETYPTVMRSPDIIVLQVF
jgi:hypothetical protein